MTLAMRFYWALALIALLAVYAPDWLYRSRRTFVACTQRAGRTSRAAAEIHLDRTWP